MRIQNTYIRDTGTRGTGIQDTYTQDAFMRTRDICIQAMGTHATSTRDTPGMMDIVAGTVTETTGRAVTEATGVVDDMSGVPDGADGHMASAGAGDEATGGS